MTDSPPGQTATVTAAGRPFGPLRVLPARPPLAQRLVRLLPGLVIFGISLALAVEAAHGVNPWTVFHGGVAERTPLTIGAAIIVTGLVLLISFIPLREPLGLGTLLNVAVIGIVIDIALAVIPDITAQWLRLLAIGVAPIGIGLGSGLYIGAGLGPGPRDGIMTALERRGLAVWKARTAIEFTALGVGWLLGGDVGLGTLWMAGTVGIWVDLFLRFLRLDPAPS